MTSPLPQKGGVTWTGHSNNWGRNSPGNGEASASSTRGEEPGTAAESLTEATATGGMEIPLKEL